MADVAPISRPSNAILRCAFPVACKISGKREGSRDRIIHRRCRRCWQCCTSATNNMVGKLLAEASTCERVELWTLTYNNKTAESRAGAKQRNPWDVQKFQKAFRQRERRGLVTFNRRETKKAALEGRDPKLKSLKTSYIRFYPVFELGGKTKRGHWHVLVFLRSHGEISYNGHALNEPTICPDTAYRVWNLPDVRGAETEGLPPEAGNPDVIDWRVRETGSQVHGLWDHGYVNIKCLSHNMQATDFGGNPVQQRKPREAIVAACIYLFKYLHKPEISFDGKENSAEKIEADEQKLISARGGSRLYRSGSCGLGTDYAKAFGETHASSGTPLHHVHFKILGANVPRSPASLHKFEQNLGHLEGAQKQQYLMDAQKMVFQMQGGMLNAAADTFLQLAKDRGMPDAQLGHVGLIRSRQLAAKTANAWLRSAEGEFRRKTARDLTMLDHLWAKEKLSKLHNSVAEMVSGVFFDKQMPKVILPPEPWAGYLTNYDNMPNAEYLERNGCKRQSELDKLQHTAAAIALIGDTYRRVAIDPVKYHRHKERQSQIKGFAAPFVSADERFKRGNVDEQNQALRERLVDEEWEQFLSGDNDASDVLFAISLAQGKTVEPVQPAWSVVENETPAPRLLKWLNFSEQFDWPERRAEQLNAYCAVRNIMSDLRLIITPDGRVLLGKRQSATLQRRYFVAGYEKTKTTIGTHPDFIEKWVYREIFDWSEAHALRIIPSSERSAPIFSGDVPFKNTWAMSTTDLQRAVLALPCENESENRPKKERPKIAPTYHQKMMQQHLENIPI